MELLRDIPQDGVVVVAYSGGKDSTVLLDLALKHIKDRQIVVLHGNTRVENPVIHKHSMNFLAKLEEWARREGRKIEIRVYEPDDRRTFWVNLLGKGYPLPYATFRWCQRHLKIKPSSDALKDLEGVLLVGMRKDESTSRKTSMKKRLSGYRLGKNGKFLVYAPIMDWSEEDVWEYLTQEKSPWGEDYLAVVELYKGARGECPLIPEKGQKKVSGCGSRFGCWVCTVVREDRTLKNQAENDPVLKELYEFRNWMLEFLSKPESRTGNRRNGAYLGEGKGSLRTEARKEVLQNLLDLQERIQIKLIDDKEIKIIENMIKREEERCSGTM